MAKKQKNKIKDNEPIEKQLWKSADKLRKNIDAAEYKHYVGLPKEDDDFDFKERFTSLKAEFEEQLKEEEKLNKVIIENLKKVKI